MVRARASYCDSNRHRRGTSQASWRSCGAGHASTGEAALRRGASANARTASRPATAPGNTSTGRVRCSSQVDMCHFQPIKQPGGDTTRHATRFERVASLRQRTACDASDARTPHSPPPTPCARRRERSCDAGVTTVGEQYGLVPTGCRRPLTHHARRLTHNAPLSAAHPRRRAPRAHPRPVLRRGEARHRSAKIIRTAPMMGPSCARSGAHSYTYSLRHTRTHACSPYLPRLQRRRCSSPARSRCCDGRTCTNVQPHTSPLARSLSLSCVCVCVCACVPVCLCRPRYASLHAHPRNECRPLPIHGSQSS
jgi:hypothetical protein